MDRETAEVRTVKRITFAQQWFTEKLKEARRDGFFGELTVTLKFEDGYCVMSEQVQLLRMK